MISGNNILNLPKLVNDFDKEYKDIEERINYIANFFDNIVPYNDLGEYKQTHSKYNINFKRNLGKENIKYLKYLMYWKIYQDKLAIVTVDIAITNISNFIEMCKESAYSDFIVINTKRYMIDEYIERYHNKIKNCAITLRTSNSYLLTIINFLNFLNEQGLASFDFIDDYDAHKIFPYQTPEKYFIKKEYETYLKRLDETTRDKPFNYNDLEKLVLESEKCMPQELHTCYMIALHTGMRVTEILNLHIDCTSKELVNNEWVYWLSKYKFLKGRQKAWQDGSPHKITKEMYDLIWKQIKIVKTFQDDCPENLKNMLLTRHFKKNKFAIPSPSYICQKKKILEEQTGIAGITIHRFRHTYAKLQYDKGIPLEFIIKFLNHQTGDMSASYINHDEKEDAKKFKIFLDMKNISGGAKDKAKKFQERLNSIYINKTFQGMSEENQIELLNRVANDEGVNIQIMDHGICMLPNLEMCPNKYTTVNSCIEEHCDKFIVDDTSISFIEKLKEYKEKSLENLKKMNFKVAYDLEEKRLNNTIDVLNDLKMNEKIL